MRRIDRILLAIQAARPGHVALRASLLGPILGIERFDVIAVKRASAGIRGATTACAHLEVDGGALSAVVDTHLQALGPVRFPADLDGLWTLRQGSPAGVIAAAAERVKAGLTLVAASTRPLLPHWVRSSANADLIRQYSGAVLLVHAAPREPYRSVVVATDLSRASLRAARVAALLAPAARFVFVHACQLPHALAMHETDLPPHVMRAQRGRIAEAARKELDAFIDLFLHGLPHGAREVQVGTPVEAIRGCARRHAADLVVVGRGATHPGARLSCSNVMQRLVDDSGCDLLVGPDAQGDAPGQRLAA